MSKEKFYDTIADNFDSIMNMYDTNRRIEVIFEDFLGKENLSNVNMLDAGCGTGHFTLQAVKRGANVTSIDISPKLVEITQKKCPQIKAIEASILDLPFKDNTFDIVFSSDVIEHTPDPYKATQELIRVLKPGGKLCITVPNKTFWYFSVVIANIFKLRKYQGLENWMPYFGYKKFLLQNNLIIEKYKGIHLFPFLISKLNPLLRYLDKKLDTSLGFMMVNLATFATKKK